MMRIYPESLLSISRCMQRFNSSCHWHVVNISLLCADILLNIKGHKTILKSQIRGTLFSKQSSLLFNGQSKPGQS